MSRNYADMISSHKAAFVDLCSCFLLLFTEKVSNI